MTPTDSALRDLIRRLADAQRSAALTQAEIASRARLDPSQVSKIMAGRFKRFGTGVVQVCKALGVALEGDDRLVDEADPEWVRLETSMRRAWDRTPEGADRLACILDAVADLRGAPGVPDADRA